MSALTMVSDLALGVACGAPISLVSTLIGAHIGSGIGSCIDACLSCNNDQSAKVQRVSGNFFGIIGSMSIGLTVGSLVISHITTGASVPYKLAALISSSPVIVLTCMAYSYDKFAPQNLKTRENLV